MERVIAAQGRQAARFEPGERQQEVRAETAGRVGNIDCHQIARIARLAGAPMDKGAGIYLLKKTGDRVRRGEALYRIHAQSEAGLRFAVDMAGEHAGYSIEP